MSLPPLQPPDSHHAFVRGDVRIHPSVAIAPGVILQAEPGSHLVIASGVCIGMGAVLHVYQGALEIEEGVNLGAGVLIIGSGRIERGACVGSSATVFNSSISRGQIVSPGALVGDTGRPIEELQVVDAVTLPVPETLVEPTPIVTEPESAPPTFPAANSGTNVYGQRYVNQLMFKLLPNRQHHLEPSPPPDNPWDS